MPCSFISVRAAHTTKLPFKESDLGSGLFKADSNGASSFATWITRRDCNVHIFSRDFDSRGTGASEESESISIW